MINYATEAHPTLYKARLYRSRLEARWAVFFDLMGWRFEYEPLDLGLWSPDFLLHGLEVPILCEVKPIDAIDADVCAKMACAAEEAQFRGELLLLGATPDIGGTDGWLGWLDDAYSCWLLGQELPPSREPPFGYGGFEPCWVVQAPDGRIDFCHSRNSFCGRMTGAHDGDHYVRSDYIPEIAGMWARAGNLTQWKPRR